MTDSFNIIMNPPYDGSLHLQILDTCIKFINENSEIVCLHPARWIQDVFKEQKVSWKIGKEILSHLNNASYFAATNISKQFGTGFTMDIMMGTYLKNKCNYDIKSIYNKNVNSIIEKVESKINSTLIDYDEMFKLDGWRCEIKEMAPINSSPYYCTAVVKLQGETVFSNGLNKDGVSWALTRNKCGNTKSANSPFPHSIKFSNENFANNFRDSCRSLWYRNYLYMIKYDVHVPLGKLPYMGDYSHVWTDEDYCKFFNLTKEESEFMCRKVDDYRVKDFINYEEIC